MLGLQGNSSSSKVYRCVACSATFTGLASLLVHQATHANSLSKVPAPPPAQPYSNLHDKAVPFKMLPNVQPTPPVPLPENTTPSFYICDCGEEFQDFNLMLEHKRSHSSTPQLLQPLDSNTAPPVGDDCDQMNLVQQKSLNPTVSQPHSSPSYPSTSLSPALEVTMPPEPESTLPDQVDVAQKEEATIVDNPQDNSKSSEDAVDKEPENISATKEHLPGAKQDLVPQDKTISIPSRGISHSLPRNNNLMKLLATAYMKRFQPLQSQRPSKKIVAPKTEVIPVEIATESESSTNTSPSVGELRQLLKKASTKTKAPAVGRILDSSKKSIVSLTKTLSPVVLLETRQKLIDPGSNGTQGRYQCGRCRKVFQDLKYLTEHNFLHRKERIKCCRHCKQLIIGKLPFTDKHICPQFASRFVQKSSAFRGKLPFVHKIGSFHNKQIYLNNNAKKVFFCPLCKHSYSRRYNLKVHKCQGPGSSLPQHATSSIQNSILLTSNSQDNTDTEITDGLQISKSIAVGTETTDSIKVEIITANSKQSEISDSAWSGSAKSFSPFYLKAPLLQQIEDGSTSGNSQQHEEDGNTDDAVSHEDRDRGQWTMPLDDEMEVLSIGEDADSEPEVKQSVSEESEKPAQITRLPYFIKDGVKRYPCNRCQKTYSRLSTLRRHLRLCGFRSHGFGATSQSDGDVSILGATQPFTDKVKPLFDCFVCGKSFTRKDNMLAHIKKCMLKRTTSGMDSVTLQPNFSGSGSEGQIQQDDVGNWGIMSLPSVLPRRVTCECGAGFTSPRLLLEHLQKHAQESYTCPTCGETVNSWADYEVHLQIHMHPHHLLYKGLQPQRSQPLLLRFQQQTSQQQPVHPQHQPPLKQPRPFHLPGPSIKKQRIACMRCNNTFSSRCSLRRHISLNRCKGGQVGNPPKPYRCSRCNTDLPNAVSLIFHQRSGICKPAIKPERCPVCPRWFANLEGLQKHLLTHNQSQSHHCDVCQGNYPTLKSLKNHRRRVHRIMAGDSVPKPEQV
ncbi:zinc finger protein Xfin [Lampris incognitus]|uniref:zinc finger protein Xfin n=1 Tax=Lampris incognitus TaxID=2546036 RepID=UPI0024B5CE48|nr:zinc finger protein Xfin [Lampris incognitus]